MRILTLVSFALCFMMLLVNCQKSDNEPQITKVTPSESPSIPERGFYMGFLPMPAEGQSFEESYLQAAVFADFIPVWGRPSPFYELADDLSGSWGQTFVEQYARGHGMFPIINVSFIGNGMTLVSPPDIIEPTLSNTEWRQAYRQSVLDVVQAIQPYYLSLGNEVNRWYEKYGAAENDANGFQNYVSLYEEIYDAVKEISPKTEVFCTFAREIVSEYREADMTVLNMFNSEKMDILMMTSYPHSLQGVNHPEDVPDDYYSKLLEFMPGKQMGFSEVAWPSLEAFGGEQSQANFLDELCERLTSNRGVELLFLGWPWLHDLDDNDSIGLIKKEGNPKLAYEVWKSISITGQWTTREQSIPATAVKITPETDLLPPILHSEDYAQPVPMPSPINSRGAEDSGFIMPDGETFYIWFTPDPSVPAEQQLFDGVTGLYVSRKVDGVWQEPQRIWVQDPETLALDGCLFVLDNTMWFASARTGYTDLNWFTANFINEEWTDWKEAKFNPDYEVGELHISADGQELYFHSAKAGGKGQYDIWVSQKEDGQWLPPENVQVVNSSENEGWPCLNQDGNELWFTRTYMGSPAIFRSQRLNGEWQEPELIISQFAAEPSLDNEGNIYFTHHYYKDGVMLEADFYVAMKKA